MAVWGDSFEKIFKFALDQALRQAHEAGEEKGTVGAQPRMKWMGPNLWRPSNDSEWSSEEMSAIREEVPSRYGCNVESYFVLISSFSCGLFHHPDVCSNIRHNALYFNVLLLLYMASSVVSATAMSTWTA